jgi:hypothetical protein
VQLLFDLTHEKMHAWPMSEMAPNKNRIFEDMLLALRVCLQRRSVVQKRLHESGPLSDHRLTFPQPHQMAPDILGSNARRSMNVEILLSIGVLR